MRTIRLILVAFGCPALSIASIHWTPMSSQPMWMWGSSSIVWQNAVYAFGDSTYMTPAWRYDPATGGWQCKAAAPFDVKITAVGFVGDKAYIVGGGIGSLSPRLDMVLIYDFAADSWTVGPAIPAETQFYFAAAVDGIVYAGSNDWNIPGPLVSPLFMAFDPAAGTWTTKAPMPTPRTHLATAVLGNKIFTIGGSTTCCPIDAPSSVVEVYDPASNTWSTVASLATARIQSAATVVGGRIYVAGGLQD